MTKQNGLGDNFYVDGYDISGDVASLSSITSPRAVLDVTGIDKSAYERIHGLKDGTMAFTTHFNVDANRQHDVLSAFTSADRILTYARGTVLGNPGACLVAKQIDYAPTRADDGKLTVNVNAQGNGYGLEWGKQHTAGKRTDTTATNGASVDWGTGSTLFGFQAYLQVFSFTGTSVTIKVQSSTDNGAGDAFADVTGGAFASVTGRTVQRIATANNTTIERYLRVVTTGTFSSAVFNVVVVRNYQTPAF